MDIDFAEKLTNCCDERDPEPGREGQATGAAENNVFLSEVEEVTEMIESIDFPFF